MYSPTDIFEHASHVAKLGGNQGCARCHRDPAQVKNRSTATACSDCHAEMSPPVQLSEQSMSGFAAGYMDAMHHLCVDCHEQRAQRAPLEFAPGFLLCSNCHRDVDGSQLRRTAPYISSKPAAMKRQSGVGGTGG